MKRTVFVSLWLAMLPWVASAQSVDDDLYYTPKKSKQKTTTTTVKEPVKEIKVSSGGQVNVWAPNASAVVVRDKKGNVRDVDEYNRRYSAQKNEFSVKNDTLYIGTLCMRRLMCRGIGMCTMMAYMLIFSRLSATGCGGIGVSTPSLHGTGVGTGALGLTRLITVGAGIGAMVRIGVGAAGTILSILIIGMRMGRLGAGAVAFTGDTRVIVRITVLLRHKEGTTGETVLIPVLALPVLV